MAAEGLTKALTQQIGPSHTNSFCDFVLSVSRIRLAFESCLHGFL
jgi:hypothetical protein